MKPKKRPVVTRVRGVFTPRPRSVGEASEEKRRRELDPATRGTVEKVGGEEIPIKKKRRRTGRLTLGIPVDLERRMDQHPGINWSEVCRRRIAEVCDLYDRDAERRAKKQARREARGKTDKPFASTLARIRRVRADKSRRAP